MPYNLIHVGHRKKKMRWARRGNIETTVINGIDNPYRPKKCKIPRKSDRRVKLMCKKRCTDNSTGRHVETKNIPIPNELHFIKNKKDPSDIQVGLESKSILC
jgi:hypothetical protein